MLMLPANDDDSLEMYIPFFNYVLNVVEVWEFQKVHYHCCSSKCWKSKFTVVDAPSLNAGCVE